MPFAARPPGRTGEGMGQLKHQLGLRRRGGSRTFIRVSAVSGAAALAFALAPAAAYASATMSASATSVWGATDGAARANAEAGAFGNLRQTAQAQGYSTCVNVTYSDTLYYVVPSGGGYVYNSTATGLCGNVVFHPGPTMSATGPQTWNSTYGSAQQSAETNARSVLLQAAQAQGYSTCVNITYSDTLVYAVPSGGGDVFVSTATGVCGTQTFQ